MKRKASIPRICRVFRGAIVSKSSILAARSSKCFHEKFKSLCGLYRRQWSGFDQNLAALSGFTVGFTLLLVRRDFASMRLPN
jgi:hypothetical protein